MSTGNSCGKEKKRRDDLGALQLSCCVCVYAVNEYRDNSAGMQIKNCEPVWAIPTIYFSEENVKSRDKFYFVKSKVTREKKREREDNNKAMSFIHKPCQCEKFQEKWMKTPTHTFGHFLSTHTHTAELAVNLLQYRNFMFFFSLSPHSWICTYFFFVSLINFMFHSFGEKEKMMKILKKKHLKRVISDRIRNCVRKWIFLLCFCFSDFSAAPHKIFMNEILKKKH